MDFEVRCRTCRAGVPALSRALDLRAKRPIGCRNSAVIQILLNINTQTPGVEVQDICRNVEDLGDLFDHSVPRRIASIMLQIVQPWRQNSPTILTAEMFGDRLLRQSRGFACAYDHLSECLHLLRLFRRAHRMKHQHPGLIHRSCGFFLADRTRSGFSGLLRPLAAVLGPTLSCGKPVKVLDFDNQALSQ